MRKTFIEATHGFMGDQIRRGSLPLMRKTFIEAEWIQVIRHESYDQSLPLMRKTFIEA